MSVGLLNFFITQSQECYLTLKPTITYFKAVYKTHTMFAVESIAVPSESSRPVSVNSHNGFNTVFSYEIPRAGDLISKIYIQIKLPRIDTSGKQITANENKLDTNKQTILENASKVYAMVYQQVKTFFISDNNHDIHKHKSNVTKFIANNVHLQSFYSLINIAIKKREYDCVYGLDTLNIENVINDSNITNKAGLMNNVENLLQRFITVKRYFIKNIDQNSTNKVLFAWVKKVGYAIINSITVYIGGQKIDEHTGTWLNVWYELTSMISTERILNEMIGNVPCLTELNSNSKPKYILKIPLAFWFCRHYASCLPLTSLQYQKVRIELTTSSLKELLSVVNANDSNTNNIDINSTDTNNLVCIEDFCNALKSNINPVLFVDYVYLDGVERKEFACKPQEYIIDQLQIYSEPVRNCNLAPELDYFFNPIREFIWVLQHDWNKYEKIHKASVILYDSNLVEDLSNAYFNYVQPYQYHQKTPQDGIYTYSFSLYPEELQSSGSANFSVIKGSKILMERSKLENKHVLLIIFARSVNVLRFIDGYGGLAFTYG